MLDFQNIPVDFFFQLWFQKFKLLGTKAQHNIRQLEIKYWNHWKLEGFQKRLCKDIICQLFSYQLDFFVNFYKMRRNINCARFALLEDNERKSFLCLQNCLTVMNPWFKCLPPSKSQYVSKVDATFLAFTNAEREILRWAVTKILSETCSLLKSQTYLSECGVSTQRAE